eukprot:5596411-Amphidinium_carterae.1
MLSSATFTAYHISAPPVCAWLALHQNSTSRPFPQQQLLLASAEPHKTWRSIGFGSVWTRAQNPASCDM